MTDLTKKVKQEENVGENEKENEGELRIEQAVAGEHPALGVHLAAPVAIHPDVDKERAPYCHDVRLNYFRCILCDAEGAELPLCFAPAAVTGENGSVFLHGICAACTRRASAAFDAAEATGYPYTALPKHDEEG